MKHFLKQNSIVLLLFFISIGATVYFYSRSQIPTIQTTVTTLQSNVINETVTTTFDQLEKKQEIKKTRNQKKTPPQVQTQATSTETATEKDTRSETDEAQITVVATLSIPKIGYEKTVNLPPGSNAYDLMETLREQGLQYDAAEHGSLGAFLSSIGGIENDYKKHMFWIYYVNGQKANIGISNYILTQDDIITWQYEAEDI